MSNSQGHLKIFLAVVAAGFLAVAGCSNQEQTPNPAAVKKAAPKPANRPAPAQPAATAAAKPASGKAATAKPVSASAKVSAPTKLVTVPKGTLLTTTLGQSLASNKNKAGDSFAATLTSSVKVNGKTVIPKGAHVTGHVVSAKKKGPELTVALASIELGGKSYPLATNSVGPADQAKSKSSDNSDASNAKNITVAAQTHLKFKLAKSVKVPVKS
jgi:uncharacterized protein YejL (UPF0352 family)